VHILEIEGDEDDVAGRLFLTKSTGSTSEKRRRQRLLRESSLSICLSPIVAATCPPPEP
jgi:hypothetical protein